MHGNAAYPLILGLIGLGMVVILAIRPFLDEGGPASGPVPAGHVAAATSGLAAFGPSQAPMPVVLGDAAAIVRAPAPKHAADSVGRCAHRRSVL